MNIKQKIIVFTVYSLGLIALGAFFVPTKYKLDTKEVVDITKKTDENTTVVHQKKKIITKDGTITEIDTDVTKHYKSATDDKLDVKEEHKEITKAGGRLTISALAGVDVSQPYRGIVYGIALNKDLIGPIGIIAFGLSTGTMGAGLSLSF